MPAKMAKALPIKTKRRSTAAYAASQPLFDALRNGMQRLADQRANLQVARDTVQKLHVKLPTESISTDGTDSHEKYMDGAVKAWRMATESYAEIFEALAEVTAAEPSAGRDKSEGHEAFVKMASTAREAYEAAMDWNYTAARSGSAETSASSRSGAGDQEDRTEAVTTGAKEDDAQSTDTRPINPILMSLLKKKPSSDAQEVPAPPPSKTKGAEKEATPVSAVGSTKKGDRNAEKRSQKRQKRKEMRAMEQAKEGNDGGAGTGKPNGIGAKAKKKEFNFESGRDIPPGFVQDSKDSDIMRHASSTQNPDVEEKAATHDDVSAEVAARLKAKDEKTQVAKEKKRKRQSAESMENGAPVHKAEKPQKKKTKGNEGEVVENAARAEKARKHVRDGEGAVEVAGVAEAQGGGRKKRKKH